MNASAIMKAKQFHQNNENFVVEGFLICDNCGGTSTTVLKKAVYCRNCRNFRLFRKVTKQAQASPEKYDDDD